MYFVFCFCPHVQTVSTCATDDWRGISKVGLMSIAVQNSQPSRTVGKTPGGPREDKPLPIKIEWGTNIPTLWGSPFKTRACYSCEICQFCRAEATRVFYSSCDEWPISIWSQRACQLGAATWPDLGTDLRCQSHDMYTVNTDRSLTEYFTIGCILSKFSKVCCLFINNAFFLNDACKHGNNF